VLHHLVVTGLVAIPAIAMASPAELALGELQLQLEPRSSIFEEDVPESRYWRGAGFAQVAGGNEGGAIGVGGALAVSGLGCDIVDVAAQGRLQPLTDTPVIGDGRYSLCLSRLLVTVVWDGRRSFGIAPGISARASLWRRPYSHEHDRLTIALGELFVPGSHNRHTIMSMSIGHGTTKQADGDEQRTIKELDFEFVMYRHRHVNKRFQTTLDTIAFTSSAMKAGTTNQGSVTAGFFPVRGRIESPDGWLAGQVGWGIAGGSVSASGSTEVDGEVVSSWSETIDSAGLPEFTTLAGEVAAGKRWPGSRFEASTSVSRAFYPTFDGNLALEERLLGSASIQLGSTARPTTVTLSPFAARTHTWTRELGQTRDASVGASLHVGRNMSKLLRVDGIGELGVSPYARLDGDRAPKSQLGSQVLVALSARRSR
jgi:hypothetical protein